MSIQISIKATGLNLSANLRDDSLAALIQLVQENRDESVASPSSLTDVAAGIANTPIADAPRPLTGHNNEQAIKELLKDHGAAELLNRLKWDSFPEKILLLGAWYEARGGANPWRRSELGETFNEAQENPAPDFPPELKKPLKHGQDTVRT